jgi:hypothetical protein
VTAGTLGALLGLAICVLVFMVFIFWLVAERRGAERDRRFVLARRAEEQHAAILEGNYCAGSYGSYWPPKDFRYLTVPDWKPEPITTGEHQ